MQELKTKSAVRLNEVTGKNVRIFLQSSFYTLSGTWYWDMVTEAVFCSDVMFSLPQNFTGTKAIFHPDDLAGVKEKLFPEQQIGYLEFRIITTYGEVKTLVGKNILVIEEEQETEDWQHQALQVLMQEAEQKATRSHLSLLREIDEKTSRFSGIGTWYYNATTHQSWYSDAVFRLHGLPAQSLNAHLHTFHTFIHPEDRDFVVEFTSRAFREKAPLHIEYRIVVADQEKWVAYKSLWFFSEKGEDILGGTLQDITGQKSAEREIEAFKNLVQFQRQQLLYDEQQANFGHWQVSLLTRKTTYSDQYYRIFGIKPHSLAPGITSFFNYIHPDDRERVEASFRKIIHEHAVPDMEYRIIRSDGKTRYILQKAKLLMYEQEMIVSGIIQDITVQRMLEKKVASLHESLQLKAWLLQQGDEVSNTVSWVMDLEEKTIEWSESFYKLVGYLKTQPANITEKTLFSIIHPHDAKAFRIQWEEAAQQKKPAAFSFRTMQRGTVRYMRAVFSHQTLNEKNYFLGTIQDITGEEVLQQRLSHRAQMAESLAENIQDRVIITDINNNILLWNKACELAYDVKKADAIGQNFFDVFPHLKNGEEMQMFQRVMRGEKVVLEGVYSPLGNGYFNLYLTPLYLEQEVTGMLHVVHDVTKESELRNSLNERLQLIESIVQSSVDRIIALDRNMNYLYWNKRAEEYYDLPKEKVVGKNILEVFPALVNDPSYEEVRKALKGETVYIPADAERGNYFETYLIPIKSGKGEVVNLLWITHDLTQESELRLQEQKAQVLLQEEHRRLKAAQAIGRVGSFEWDAATDQIHWSDEMYRIHGLEPQSEEITLERVLSFIPKEENVPGQLLRLRKEAGEIEVTHRIIRADGKERIVTRKLKSFAGEDGSVTHLSGTIQDITEQVAAQQRLKEREALLRQAEEVANAGSYEADLSTHSFRLSDGLYRLFGEEPGSFELSLEWIDSRSHPEDAAAVRQILERAVQEKKPYTYTRRIYRKDGEMRTLEAHGKVICDEAGNAIKFIGLVQDITERKKAEQELLRLKEELAQKATDKYRVLFNSIDEGVYLCEVVFDEGNHPVDIRYLEENQAAVGIIGTSFVGKTLKEINPAYEGHWYQTWGEVALTGETKRLQEYSEPDKKWFDFYISRLGDNSSRQVVVVFQDITERRRTEQRQAYLLQLIDVLRTEGDPVEIQYKAATLLGEFLGAARAGYAEDVGDGVSVILTKNYTNGVPGIEGTYKYDDYGPELVKELRVGRTVVRHDIANDASLTEAEKAAHAVLQLGATANVPLLKNGNLLAILFVHFTVAHQFSEQEIALIEETAERTWAAVERAKAEEALRRSEAQIAAVFEALPVGIGFVDLNGQLILSNEEMRRFLPTNLIPSQDEERYERWLAYHPDGRRIERQDFPGTRALRGERVVPGIEFLYMEDDGKQIWTRVAAVPVRNDEGSIIGQVSVVTDMTLLKEAEEQLRDSALMLEQQVTERTRELQESKLFLEQVMDASPDFIMVFNLLTRKIEFISKAAYRGDEERYNETLQLDYEGILARAHPDDRQALHQYIESFRTAPDHALNELEYRVLKGNEVIWYRARGKVFRRNEEGTATHYISIVQDITKNKKAEADLQKSLTILQSAEELAQIGSWEYEIDTGNFNWSDGMYGLFGLPKGTKVKPEAYLDFAIWEDRSVAKRIVKNLKRGHLSFEETMRIKREDGIRLLKLKGSVVNDENGKTQRVIGVDVDITDIREAEERLRQSQNLLEQTALASPDAITVYDLQKKQPHYLNNCLAEWIGSTVEELVSIGIDGRLQLIHPDDRLHVLHFNEKMKAAKDGRVLTIEYRISKKDDTLLWVRNRSKVFRRDEAGKVTHILSVLQDITEEKATERVLKALNASLEKKNKELESANEEITSFAFVASHDLKEPLRKIHTFSNWLLTKETSLSGTGKQGLEKMNAAVKRLDLLINDILVLTKIHVDNERLKPVDLNALLQQLKEDMQDLLQETGAVVEAQPLPTIIGAGNHLLYLMKNLIGNAIKFQPPGGQPHIIIKAEKEEQFLKLSFNDNGIGIAPEYHSRIFEMFKRLHGRTEYEGTGMGLTISKKIMEKHGGKITVESEEGKGATFVCWFPLALSTK